MHSFQFYSREEPFELLENAGIFRDSARENDAAAGRRRIHAFAVKRIDHMVQNAVASDVLCNGTPAQGLRIESHHQGAAVGQVDVDCVRLSACPDLVHAGLNGR